MSVIISYVRKIFSNAFDAFGGFQNHQNTEHSEPTINIEVPNSGKRRQNENIPEIIISKRRKLDPNYLNGLENIPSSSNNYIKMTMNERHLRNTRANRRKTLGVLDFSNASDIQGKKSNIYSCDCDNDNSDELSDCKVFLQRTESNGIGEVNQSRKINTNNIRQGSLLQNDKPFSAHMCHQSQFCLQRIHQEQDQATLFEMVKKYTGASVHRRKTLPLTTSTVHNTKQNDQIVSNTYLNKGYFLRQFSSLATRSSSVKKNELTNETVADKTIIDLTGDDDDNERQIIETSVVNSPELKNFRSNFSGKDSPVVSPDYIKNLLRKYDLRRRSHDLQVQKMRKDLQKNKEEFNKSLAEIIEKRLVLKEYVIEEKSTKDLAPITDAMLEEMRKILSSGKKPLVQIRDTGIKAQDIYTLHDCNWLNDEIINAYMNLIKSRAENNREKYPQVHCFNTFFYQQLLNRGYSSVRRWTKKVDIFDYTIIIVPIHLGNHWCLAEVRAEEKTIRYYDSLGSPNNRCLETLLQYLASEYEDKKGGKFNLIDWKIINVPRDEIPKQKNAYDCGVFACTYAEHLTRNSSFNFVQEDMGYFREKMTYEILTGNLLL